LRRFAGDTLPWGNPKARQQTYALEKPGCRSQTVFRKRVKNQVLNQAGPRLMGRAQGQLEKTLKRNSNVTLRGGFVGSMIKNLA